MIKVGILSDTHLDIPNELFVKQCAYAFTGCEIIIHAGDLVDSSLLAAFKGKEVHGVAGNMCNQSTRQLLPKQKQLVICGFSFGITHGAGPRHNIEERVFEQFPTADCIVFGHTHQPLCRKFGPTLLINPGSFTGTGKYGAPGTYGIISIDEQGLDASISTLPDHL